MGHAGQIRFQLAGAADVDGIATLHADSWRRHYRGAYRDAFLDGDVHGDRLAVWSGRLRQPNPQTYTLVAEDEQRVVAFAHTFFDDDPIWGALLENLHVLHTEKRQGIGSRLLAMTARAVRKRDTGFYLWVLEQNVDAQMFYAARGGRCIERALVEPPDGMADILDGSPIGLRYA